MLLGIPFTWQPQRVIGPHEHPGASFSGRIALDKNTGELIGEDARPKPALPPPGLR